MQDRQSMTDEMGMSATRGLTEVAGLALEGAVRLRCVRPDGELRWEHETPNLIPNEMENHALGVIWGDVSKITTWSVGLLASGVGTPAETWTLGSTGFSEQSTGFSETARQSYDVPTGTPTGQSIDNTGSPASFSMTATGTVGGAFIASTSTLGGTGGILSNVATDSRTFQSGDTIQVEYTNNAGGS